MCEKIRLLWRSVSFHTSLCVLGEFFMKVFKGTERSLLEVNHTWRSSKCHGKSVWALTLCLRIEKTNQQDLLLKVRHVRLKSHIPLLFLDKLYQNRVGMSEKIIIRSFLSLLIKTVNYWAEICHLLIKFNSNFFLQTHAEDKLSISVNHN